MHPGLALAAAAPLVSACVLLARRTDAARAAGVSTVMAVVLAVWLFPVPGREWTEMAGSLGPVLLEVLVIILGGVLLSEVLARSGAQDTIARWIERITTSTGRGVILVVLGVTPFAESVTGFGLGVIVAIPILLHLGLSRARAAATSLLGLVLVPWGSLAPGTLVAAELGGVDLVALGTWSAIFTLPVLVIMGTAALCVAVGRRQAVRHLPELALVVAVMWGVLLLANITGAVSVAGVLAGVSAAATVIIVSRVRHRASVRLGPDVRRALTPYAFLIVALLLASVVVRLLDLAGLAALVASPALWLLLSCAVATRVVGTGSDAPRTVLAAATGRWRPVAVTTVLFLVLGGVLTASGMSAYLAGYLAQVGSLYLAFIPFVGALGGYITGSNTGSSAMFAASATSAADALGASGVAVLGAQNVASSAALMAAPSKILLAWTLAAPVTVVPDHLAGAEEEPTEGPDDGGGARVTRTVLPIVLTTATVLGLVLLVAQG